MNISQSQRPYFSFWLKALLVAEGTMLIMNQQLFVIYGTIAVLFLGGFLLRVTKFYPGQDEPLILDLSAVILAGIYAYLGQILISSNWRFLLILTSSMIILPHIIFIAKEK